MEKFLKQTLSQISGFWQGLDSGKRKKFVIIASSLLIAAIFLTYLITKPQYSVLYSSLESQEAGEILKKLEEGKINVKIDGNGTIMVPKGDEARIRMNLAAEGYPKSGLNYSDLTQGGLGLGATDYDKKKAAQYQLQQRLQSAITTMEGVKSAIVTITIPEQDSFVLKQDKLPATASVLLNLTSNLNSKQVKGIVDLVSKSVPGLQPENISIVDSNMNTLNAHEQAGTGAVSTQLELEAQVKESLQKQVIKLLGPVFGEANVLPSVSFKLNFDKKVVNSVRFEPVTDDSGIAVSINELREEISSGQGVAGGQTQYPIGQGNENGDYIKSDKTVNYEVNQINEQLEKAQGEMTDLKLSVLINSNSLDNNTISNIQKLVANAIGVENSSVVVQAMVFSGAKAMQDELTKTAEEMKSKEFWNQIGEIGKYLVLVLILAFIMFILFRLFTNLKIEPAKVVDNVKMEVAAPFIDDVIEMPEEDKEQIMKKERIDNLIDNKPEVVAQQIREWLNES